MIWEVDENLDGCVDWEELQLTYYRNRHDTTGLEPFTLYNIIQVRERAGREFRFSIV